MTSSADSARAGRLRLFSQPSTHNDLARTPNLLLQKFPARAFAVETQLELQSGLEGLEAGIVITGGLHIALAVRAKGQGGQVVFYQDGHEQIISSLSSGRVKLRVAVEDGGRCGLSAILDDGTKLNVPERFQASAGKWIGAKVGLYCRAVGTGATGSADFDYFRFST